MAVELINITDVQADETNVNWYANGERANEIVLNRPIKEVAGIVNTLISEYNTFTENVTGAAGDISFIPTDDITATNVQDAIEQLATLGVVGGGGSGGNSPMTKTTFTATEGQTTFAVEYILGLVDVYVEGIRLVDGTDFTATDGSNIILASEALEGDTVEIIAFQAFADAYTKAEVDAKIESELSQITDINDSVTSLDSTWSSSKIEAELSEFSPLMISKPIITSPTDGQTDFTSNVTATYTTSESYAGTQDYVEWQLASDINFNTILDSYSGSSDLTSYNPSISTPLTTVYVRVRQGSDNHVSTWSDTVSFVTPDVYVAAPSLTVEGAPSDVIEEPSLSSGTFTVVNGSDTHASTDWIVETTGGSVVWSSLNDASNLTSITVPAGNLSESTEYVFKVRYNGGTYGSSAYTTVNATTLSQFFNPLTDDPVPIGSSYEGGYYAGKMQQDDGIYALIVAPRGLGDNNSNTTTWHSSAADTTGADSTYDGYSNTQDMLTYTSGGIKTWIQNVNSTGINGYNDWYLPAIHELQLCYRNLKPTTASNSTVTDNIGDGCTALINGNNPYSVPVSPDNTSTVPAQTDVSIFQSGGSEAFVESSYWSSTERCDSPTNSWVLGFYNGYVDDINKNNDDYVRAVRRLKLS